MAVAKGKPDYLKLTKGFVFGHKAISILIAALLICGVSALLVVKHIQHQHQVEMAKLAQQKYESELTQLKTINNQYYAVFREFVSLPSTTTKTQAEWDSYYDDLSSQLSPVRAAVNKNTFVDSRLSTAYNDLSNAVSDLNNDFSLSKSISDMQFQIDNDKSKLSTDQSTLSSEESIYNNADGLISNSYVTEFQTDVASDKTQLSTDQNTYQSQQTQASTLTQTVLQDSLAVTKSTNALGL